MDTNNQEFFEDEEVDKKKKEPMTEEERRRQEQKEKKQENAMMGGTVVLSIVLAVAVFMMLPYYLSTLFQKVITSQWVIALLEGVIRLVIFIGYVARISGVFICTMVQNINVLTALNMAWILPWIM